MELVKILLLLFLIICAIAVSFTKGMLTTIITYTSYSLVMSMIWILLESPDLAITEAAVGAGVTGVLFFITMKKIEGISEVQEEDDDEQTEKEL